MTPTSAQTHAAKAKRIRKQKKLCSRALPFIIVASFAAVSSLAPVSAEDASAGVGFDADDAPKPFLRQAADIEGNPTAKSSSISPDKKSETMVEIVGGEVLPRGVHPFLVNLGGCGGSLISSRVVLTAAHCYSCSKEAAKEGKCKEDAFFPDGKWLELNRYDKDEDEDDVTLYQICSGNSKQRKCADVVRHPSYKDGDGVKDDLALIILPKDYSKIKPVALAREMNVSPGDMLEVIGWGKTNATKGSRSRSNVPRTAMIEYVSDSYCEEYYRSVLGMMCCYTEGRHMAGGDSGGPLLKQVSYGSNLVVQVGIVIDGDRKNDPNMPNRYTRVSDYIDWIETTACDETGTLCPDPMYNAQKDVTPLNSEMS